MPEPNEDASWVGVHEETTLPPHGDPGCDPRPHRVHPLVLVVDDNRDSRDVYSEWLAMKGCRVLAAEDGLQGLRLARHYLPDLIVSDISMPVMDGCEMAQHLRRHEATRGIPIVAVTGFGRCWRRAAREAGCDAVLEKPTMLPEFEALVDVLTEGGEDRDM
jgi:CheY-like chemotaxis protein